MPETVSLVQVFFGMCALASAVMVVVARSPIVSALCLMGTLFSTAFLYLAQGAYFAGVVQILIYAGAIAVLFVFIVMLLDLKSGSVRIPGSQLKVIMATLGVFLFVGVAAFCVRFVTDATAGHSMTSFSEVMESLSAKSISQNFVSTYMLPFQVTGFLILSGIVGVVMLGKSLRASFEEEEK